MRRKTGRTERRWEKMMVRMNDGRMRMMHCYLPVVSADAAKAHWQMHSEESPAIDTD